MSESNDLILAQNCIISLAMSWAIQSHCMTSLRITAMRCVSSSFIHYHMIDVMTCITSRHANNQRSDEADFSEHFESDENS